MADNRHIDESMQIKITASDGDTGGSGVQCETGCSGRPLGGRGGYLSRTWIPRMPMAIWVQRERHQQSP